MSTTDRVVNDFSIQVATVNGSGSQTSNIFLTKSLFRMGIPVAPKNMFPSNIAGLPTWYNIRVNSRGYLSPKSSIEIGIFLNQATWTEDIPTVAPGGVIIHNERMKPGDFDRDDVTWYPVPFDDLAKEKIENKRLRKPLTNIIYVGVAAYLLDMDLDVVNQVVADHFADKPKAIPLNQDVIQWSYDWAKENLEKKDPFTVEPLDMTQGQIMIEGNEAAGLGAVFAGCTVVSWYPITPASSLCESAIGYLGNYRKDENGESTYCVIQAEDELSAAGMVLGAGWAGARAMTATAGPGISLMAENLGMGYYAEMPGVFYDVQRVGPSTGLPTRTQQCDVNLLARVSHGDTKHIVVIPSSVEECFTMSYDAFDLAEKFQTPVFVMSDLDLGMNRWMSKPFETVDRPYDRGKVLTAEQLDEIEDWGRYKDVDGDGIPYRTLPGTKNVKAAYFTRGTGHDEYARYTESDEVYVRNMERLLKKYDTARDFVPKPEVDNVDGATFGLIAFGTTHHAIVEARDILKEQHGVEASYLRLRAIPFTTEIWDFIDAHDYVYVIEQNRDGQMEMLIREECGNRVNKLRHIRHYGGFPIPGDYVAEHILKQEAN